MSNYKILYKISGSIAVYKSADLISKLVQLGHQVQCVTTQSALQFIGPATLEGLTRKAIITDMYEHGKMMTHIDLVKWADITILAPATATTINRFSNGYGEDIVSTLFLAHDWSKPYFIAPAMNTKMLSNPSTMESLKKLKKWGVKILSPNSGKLACGDFGYGRMMEPKQILKLIQPFLIKTKRPSILITSGGTKEPIDSVRYITNISSGRTAAKLADYFIQNFWEVTYLSSSDAEKPLGDCFKLNFITTKELEKQLFTSISKTNFDAVIHMAAVSDFSPINASETKKFSSEKNKFVLEMKPTPKLVNNIRIKSKNKKITLIAFKLTSKEKNPIILKKIKNIFSNSDADWVVQNDIFSRKNGIQSNFNLYDRNGIVHKIEDTYDLGTILESKLKKALK
tara:strand:+ start:777 stop:1970 length:1194 start_codon:yes stop_codon:yes gene_type:complete